MLAWLMVRECVATRAEQKTERAAMAMVWLWEWEWVGSG